MIKENGEGLLFLISQPRSGSTVLQKIITNNEYLGTTSEPWVLLHMLSLYHPELIKASFDYNVMTEAVLDFFNKSCKSADKQVREQILTVYNNYLENTPYQYFLDKTPRYYEVLDDIIRLFPAAKIIILLRNPVDVLQSIARTWKLYTYEGLSKFSRDILLAPKILKKFSEVQKENPNVFTIRFEDLFENENANLRALFNWMNISFEEKYLNYKGNRKADGLFGDKTFSKTSTTLQINKVYTHDINFKDVFWQEFISGYQHYLGSEFLAHLNYTSTYDSKETNVFNSYIDFCNFKNKQTFLFRDFKVYRLGQKIQKILSIFKISK